MVLGDDEIASQKAVLKNMKTGEKKTIDLSKGLRGAVCLPVHGAGGLGVLTGIGPERTFLVGALPGGSASSRKRINPAAGNGGNPLEWNYLFGGAIWQSL